MLDGGDRAAQPLITGRQESQRAQAEQAGVRPRVFIGLNERRGAGVVATLEHVGLDRGAQLAPPVGRPGVAEPLDHLDGGVGGRPDHGLGVHELARRATHLPDPGVRLAPRRLQVGEQLVGVPGVVRPVQAGHPDRQPGGEHLGEDVGRRHGGRRVADPHRPRPVVAGQPFELDLRQPALSGQAVEFLHAGWLAGHRVAHPVEQADGLAERTGAQQHPDRRGGVPQPAVPVVPVPRAGRLLRQRGGGRGHDPAGRGVGEGLDRDQGPDHRLAPLALVGQARHPVPPPALGLVDQRGDQRRVRRVVAGTAPDHRERHLVALADRELGGRGASGPAHVRRAEQPQGFRAGDDAVGPGVPQHPWFRRTVLKRGGERHPKIHGAADTLDHPDQHRVGLPRRHAVDQAGGARVHRELGLEHQRVRPVTALHPAVAAGRRDPPVPVPVLPQQPGEAGLGVEPGQAEPVDRSVPAHQRRRVQVADQRVVLDR